MVRSPTRCCRRLGLVAGIRSARGAMSRCAEVTPLPGRPPEGATGCGSGSDTGVMYLRFGAEVAKPGTRSPRDQGRTRTRPRWASLPTLVPELGDQLLGPLLGLGRRLR